MQPWEQLAEGQTPASRTLLMDYVSMSRPKALRESLQFRHWPVTTTILISLLLKVMTAFSAGLFMLEPTTIARNITVFAIDHFDPVAFSAPNTGYYGRLGYLLPTIGTQLLNLTFPVGTSQDFAIPSMQIEDEFRARTGVATVIVDTFSSRLTCEPATIYPSATVQLDDKGCRRSMKFQVSSPSCYMPDIIHPVNECPEYLEFPDYTWSEEPSSRDYLFGVFTTAACSNLHNTTRIFIGTGFMKNAAASTLATIAETHAAFVCDFNYDVSPQAANIDHEGNLLRLTAHPMGEGSNLLGNISSSNYINLLLQDLSNVGEIELGVSTVFQMPDLYAGKVALGNNTYDLLLDGFFQLLTTTLSPATYEFLLRRDALLGSSEHLLSRLSAQFAKAHLMSPSSNYITGTGYNVKPRLRVHHLSLYVLVASTAVLILTNCVLVVVIPSSTVRCNVTHIAGVSAVLARSPKLCEVLLCSGLPSTEFLHRKLENTTCSTAMRDGQVPEFEIYLTVHGSDEWKQNKSSSATLLPLSPTQHTPEWWSPWQLRPFFKLSLIILIAGFIGSLAVLLRLSTKHDGLTFSSDSRAIHYTWVYVPTVILIAVQICIDGIGSAYQMIQPYYQLRHSPSKSAHPLFSNHPSRLVIHTLFHSVSRKQWHLVISSLAMLLAPILTTVASGLYTVGPAPSLTEVAVTHTTTFNSSFYAQIENANTDWKGLGTEFVVNTMFAFDLSQPLWTYESFAIGAIRLSDNGSVQSAGDGLTVSTPAVRASIECTKVPAANLNLTFLRGELEGWSQALFKWDTPEAAHCHSNSLILDLPPDHGIPIGNTTWLPFDAQQRVDCPSLMVIYGIVDENATGFTCLTCTVPVDQVEVEATLSPQDYRVLNITRNESTAKRFTNLSDAYVADFWGISPHLIACKDCEAPEELSSPYNNNPSSSSLWLYGHAYLDYTFMQLYDRNSHLKITDLTPDSPSAEESMERIVSALSSFAGTIHAQYINLAGRTELPAIDETDEKTSKATFHGHDRLRVQQNAISTYILVTLLVVIIACIGVLSWSVDTKKLLPFKPCSIAAVASLLVGSKMLEHIPLGAEFIESDDDLASLPVFSDNFFSMGWWGDNKATARFGIDIVACTSQSGKCGNT
ncbi:hypothetical protein F5Y18DRAFT_441745 [Xylariaceae sp. FL1019]|nr:hypothetical protein F5Y18DRAFT_441745 [Xylariaceae sp. FL1019]